MGFLVDTSIFIAWERGKLSGEEVLRSAAEQPVSLASITASELLHGVHRAEGATRRLRREQFVERLLALFPIVPFDLKCARTHSRIWADLKRSGQLVGAHDLLIAATALTHDLTVATRNEREFARVDALPVAVW